MFGLGPAQLLIFLIVILLLFGRRIPEAMFSLGKGITEFKKGMKDVEDDHETKATHLDEK